MQAVQLHVFTDASHLACSAVTIAVVKGTKRSDHNVC